MLEEPLSNPENSPEITETIKNFIREHPPGEPRLHDLVQIGLVAGNLKPGAFIAVEEPDVDSTEQLMTKLGLVWTDRPLTKDRGGKYYDIASSKDHLNRYIANQNKLGSIDEPERFIENDRINGEFLGYPKSAIEAFAKFSEDVSSPHPFWQEVQAGKSVSDDIALAMEATDVIPASTTDQNIALWGATIRNFLAKIDPELPNKFTQEAQANIRKQLATED